MNKKIMKFSISALALVMLFSGCNKDRDLKAKVGNVEIRAEQVNNTDAVFPVPIESFHDKAIPLFLNHQSALFSAKALSLSALLLYRFICGVSTGLFVLVCCKSIVFTAEFPLLFQYISYIAI